MNILITGGCGFIGSNFINYMSEKYPKSKIINVDAMYYSASYNNINQKIRDSTNYTFIKGNINDSSLIKYILSDKKITHIVHFAAQTHVDDSFENSVQHTKDNVKGTHTLLECVKLINKNIRFLHFSTDEVYGESELTDKPKHEKSILCPTNPYAASKASAEMYVNSYIHSYNLNCIITRCNNVYGSNQYPDKLIPKFIQLLKSEKKCTIHGNGLSLRSFINVYDVCTAIDIILEKGNVGEVYNIGSESSHEKSVLEVSEILIKNIIGKDTEVNKWLEYVDDRPFNDKRYFITNNKLKYLGWNQIIDFGNGIKNLL